MGAPVEVRTLRAEDAAAVTDAVRAAKDRGDVRASSDPELNFALSLFGVDPGLFGGAFVDGRLVGFIAPELKVTVVAPEERRQGLGRRLVELGLGMEGARGRTDLLMGVLPGDEPGACFLAANGFAFHSVVWDLELAPDRAVASPTWPDDVLVRSFDAGRDVQALPRLVNAAFADHPTPIVMEEAMLLASLDDPNILDDDAIVLEDGASGEPVGFCLNDVRRADGVVVSDHGEIGMIGVRPDARGRGLGRQLLRAGIGYLRSVGASRVTLAVNGRNDGALALYESEGFVRMRTRERWARPVVSAAAGS